MDQGFSNECILYYSALLYISSSGRCEGVRDWARRGPKRAQRRRDRGLFPSDCPIFRVFGVPPPFLSGGPCLLVFGHARGKSIGLVAQQRAPVPGMLSSYVTRRKTIVGSHGVVMVYPRIVGAPEALSCLLDEAAGARTALRTVPKRITQSNHGRAHFIRGHRHPRDRSDDDERTRLLIQDSRLRTRSLRPRTYILPGYVPARLPLLLCWISFLSPVEGRKESRWDSSGSFELCSIRKRQRLLFFSFLRGRIEKSIDALRLLGGIAGSRLVGEIR